MDSKNKYPQIPNNISYELFSLMMDISTLKDNKKIIQHYVKKINQNSLNLSIEHSNQKKEGKNKIFEIRTEKNSYGYLTFSGNLKSIDITNLTLLHNSVDMLAKFLEKNEQEAELQQKTAKLEQMLSIGTELLQENEEKYRTLFELSPEAIVTLTLTGFITNCNKAFYKLSGLEPSEIVNKHFTKLGIFRLSDIGNYIKIFAQIISKKESIDAYEFDWVNKNGETRSGMAHIGFVKKRGKIHEIQAIVRDTTSEKQTIEAITESEERFRNLADNIQDIFWLKDISGNTLYVNDAYCKIVETEKPLGKKNIIEEYVINEDRPIMLTFQQLLKRLEQGGIKSQYRIKTPKGTIKWLWSRVFPVYVKGKMHRIAGIMSDVTEQKLIEEELKSAKEKAMESDRLKSAFLANISHEIRTPMNAIIGFSEMIKRKNLEEDKKEKFIQIINSSSHNLLSIINDIIDISKIQTGQVEARKNLFDLNELIHEILESRKQETEYLGLDIIQTFYKKDKFLLNTDEIKIKQILSNLFNNAIKFTQSGFIEFGYDFIENQYLIKIWVKDTGIGIPLEEQDKIFELFRQVEFSLSRNYSGIGLGLAICRAYTEFLGGKITIESSPQNGSTFTLWFPASICSQESLEKKERFSPDTWPKKHILIAEDEEYNFMLIKEILQSEHLEISWVRDGIESIEFIKNNKVDLILMDVIMPRMSGIEAAKIIREIDSTIPIIAQTAYTNYTNPEENALTGIFDDILYKPINQILITRLIDKYFDVPSKQKA